MGLINSSFARINKEPCNDSSEVLQGFALPDPREFDLFICKDIQSNYVLDQDDSNKYLVFDYAGTGILRIPDNMYRGTALLVANVGVGSVTIVMDGLETIRGTLSLKDGDSFMTIVKITDSVWQCSER